MLRTKLMVDIESLVILLSNIGRNKKEICVLLIRDRLLNKYYLT